MLKVGIDATPLVHLQGGIGFYLHHHLKQLLKECQGCQFYLYTHQSFEPFAKNMTIRVIPFLGTWHSLWAQTTLSYYLARDKIDLFWGPTQSIPLIRRKKMQRIITCHDFVYLIAPKTMSSFKFLYMKMFGKKMLEKADHIFPISYGTKRRLKRYYGLSSEAVVHPPLKNSSRAKAAPFKKSYILTVGTLEPRKNLEALLMFFMKREDIPQLVIVGSRGWKNKKLLNQLRIAQQKYPQRIQWLKEVSDEELNLLYTHARYYISFSRYEGYGMPLAEARRCGTPTICFNHPEMREASENEGIFLPKKNWEKKLEDLLINAHKFPKEKVIPSYSTQDKTLFPLVDLINSIAQKTPS